MKKIFILLAASIFCFACGKKSGEEFVEKEHVQIGELYFNLHEDGKAEVTFDPLYVKFIKPVTIPAEVEYESKTYQVSRIDKGAFSNCWELRGITIPNSVTNIGSCAFDGCQHLKSIVIPNSVSLIEPCTFRNCRKLSDVTIPSGVMRIEEGAFEGCPCEYSIHYTYEETTEESDGCDDVYSDIPPPPAPQSRNNTWIWYENFYPEYDDVNDYVQDVDVLVHPYSPYEEPLLFHANQVINISINAAGQVLVRYMCDNDDILRPYEVKEPLAQYIYSYWDEHLRYVDFTENGWEERVRPYYVIITKDESIELTDPKYVTVAEQVLMAVQSVRERLAKEQYNKKYADLADEQKRPIRRAITNSIYWQNYDMTPPPPPVNEEIIEVIDDYEGYYEPEEEVVEEVVEEVEEEEVSFVIVEEMPEFPGGTAAMFKFLSENVKYPDEAAEQGIQGKAQCQFTVEKDGSITDVQIVRSAGDASLDKEAIRVIKSMPKWKPGKQRGKPVRIKSYTIPINFKLQ